MSNQRRWKLTSACLLAGATLGASSLALMALVEGSGPLAISETTGFSQVHERRAFSRLQRGGSPSELALAASDARTALGLSPYNNAARLRLAYIDTKLNGRLRSPGVTYLAQSYELIPYDYTVAAWRIRFSMEHWAELTPDLRSAVHSEVMAFGRAGSQEVDVRQILKTVRNGPGRLAAALWLRELDH